MIIGTGSDLIDIRRIEKTLARFDQRFIQRCFTIEEIERAERRRGAGTHIATYAKRFAAKEACSKALGTGLNHGVYFKDIAVINDKNGKPSIRLTGGALKYLESISPINHEINIHLTLTDEPPIAMAYVIIEGIKKEG